MQLMGVYSGMSDSALDTAYSDNYAAMTRATGREKVRLSTVVSGIAQEILDRLGSLWSMGTGVFGHTRFPKYDAIQKAHPEAGGFQQTATAQTAVKESAARVASDVGTALKWGIGGVVGLGALALALYLFTRGKK